MQKYCRSVVTLFVLLCCSCIGVGIYIQYCLTHSLSHETSKFDSVTLKEKSPGNGNTHINENRLIKIQPQ